MKSLLATSLLALSVISTPASSEELSPTEKFACAVGASYVQVLMTEDYERDISSNIILLGNLCAEGYSSLEDPEVYGWFTNAKTEREEVRRACIFGIGFGAVYFIPGTAENVEGSDFDFIKFLTRHIPYTDVLKTCTNVTVNLLEKSKSKASE